MTANQHPEYNNENIRLQGTKKAIDNFIDDSSKRKSTGANEWSSVALEKHNKDLRGKYRLRREDPYYGRMDILSETTNELEEIYIGYEALDLGEFEVIDWRAPISTLYAGGTARMQSYKAPQGKIKVQLLLRRRVTIKHGEIQEISDEFDRRPQQQAYTKKVEPKTNEEFLLNELYSRGDPKLQDIVKTIQEKQNNIIRARHDRVVIINGVAGSGKTSIAIHRMAYLLFPASNTHIQASRSIIFCPNPIFLHYIEDLLPKLGERNVQQTTFANWALSQMRIGSQYRVVDSSLNVFLDPKSGQDLLYRLWRRAKKKGSLKIKQLLEKYVEFLKHSQTYPMEALVYSKIGEFELDFEFLPEEIQNICEECARDPLASLSAIRESAWLRLQELAGKKYDADVWKKANKIKLASEIEIMTLERSLALTSDPEKQKLLKDEIKRKRNASSFFRDQAFRNRRTKNITTNLVEVFLQQEFNHFWPLLDAAVLYYALFENNDLLLQLSKGIFTREDAEALFAVRKESNVIEHEDVAAILYFYHLINSADNLKYDHIIIDEVQDFSPLQLDQIYEKSKNNSLTLVGDIAQGVHAYRGLSAWKDLADVLPQDKVSFENIAQSYRSTQEIVIFSNEILKQYRKKPLLAQPFARTGSLPTIIHVTNPEEHNNQLVKRIEGLQNKRYKNIAVIVKTLSQAIALINFLNTTEVKPRVTAEQVRTEFKYRGGLTVLPINLAKGLEFEAVIIYEANEREFNSNKAYDGGLLYIAVTRALHELEIMYSGRRSGLLVTAANHAVLERTQKD